jgi:prophage tail gpP-like protein
VPDLRLTVNGVVYTGWKSARVTRGIESISGSFDLAVTDSWGELWGDTERIFRPEDELRPSIERIRPIRPEDECEVSIDEMPLITGYVDRRTISYSAGDHSLSISGRDRTGALVDCSARLKHWEFLNASVVDLAQRLAEPFGIAVSAEYGLNPRPVPKLSVDPGDSAFDALERACRMAGVLAVSDGRGGLLLVRGGSSLRAKTALVEGTNILSASLQNDAAGRFRRYIVTAQQPGTDGAYAEIAACVRGEAQDADVKREDRELVVRSEGAASIAVATERAQWEAIVRAGRAGGVSIVVQGWLQKGGTPWPVNALVHVDSPMLGIDGDMLIVGATYSMDASSGTTTELSLKRPDAFAPTPVVTLEVSGRYKELAGGVKVEKSH